MTLTDLLPNIKQLSLFDKIQLIKLLAEDIERPVINNDVIIQPYKMYYLHTPYQVFGAAEQLMSALEANSKN